MSSIRIGLRARDADVYNANIITQFILYLVKRLTYVILITLGT